MTAAEELRAAAELLDGTGRAWLITVPDQDPKCAQRFTIVVCNVAHLDVPEERLDAFGCCADCRFLAGYDDQLAQLVVALLNAAGPLTKLLSADADWCETNPAHKHKAVQPAIDVAHTLNARRP